MNRRCRAEWGWRRGNLPKSPLLLPFPDLAHCKPPTRSQKAPCLFPLANLFIFNTLFQEGMGCQLAKCLRISLDSLEHFYKQFLKQNS